MASTRLADAKARYGGAVDVERAAHLYAKSRSLRRQIGAKLGLTATTVSNLRRQSEATRIAR